MYGFFRKAKKSVLTDAVEIDSTYVEAADNDFVKRIVDRESINDALRIVFSQKTTPDKLLAFVYNRLLCAMSGTNGSPKSIIEAFDGMPLQNIYENMVLDLNYLLGTKAPDDVLEPLRTMVYGRYYNETFKMTAHNIADSSSGFIKKVKEQKKNE